MAPENTTPRIAGTAADCARLAGPAVAATGRRRLPDALAVIDAQREDTAALGGIYFVAAVIAAFDARQEKIDVRRATYILRRSAASPTGFLPVPPFPRGSARGPGRGGRDRVPRPRRISPQRQVLAWMRWISATNAGTSAANCASHSVAIGNMNSSSSTRLSIERF
jgi:hypothetical protein